MTKSTASYVNSTTSAAAQYVAFQGVLSAQLNAVLTKTADTGQITTFNVIAVNTVRDYEVFGFSDTLQATKPIYVKVNYDFDAAGLNLVNVSVGTTTNGAGTLAGVTVAGLQLFGYVPNPAVTRYCYASSDGSQLVFVCNLQAAAATTGDSISAVIVERTRDADGTPNGNGYMVYHWKSTVEGPAVATSSYVGCYSRTHDTSAVQPGINYDYGVSMPNLGNLTSYLAGGVAYTFPAYGFSQNTIQGASKALMLGFAADLPKETVVALTHYGTSMSFLPLNQVGAVVGYMSAPGTAASKVLSPLFRWE